MAAGSVLPTYQRYINGVPVLQSNRKTLRLREKYIVLLVFVTFGTVCFGAIFFLPDLRDRVTVTGIDAVFVPRPVDVAGRVVRHDPALEIDDHQVDDTIRFKQKVVEGKTKEDIQAELDQRKKLNLTKGEHDQVKEDIQADKDKIIQQKEENDKQKEEEEKQKHLDEVKDHVGVEGGQGGVPSDEETKKRQDTVRNVSCLSHRLPTDGKSPRLRSCVSSLSLLPSFGSRRGQLTQ